MTIQVISDETKQYQNLGGTYRFVTMQCGKHSATVMNVTGEYPYVMVQVHNASNRAWRGVGKRFESAGAAKANYKTPEIREMIEHATA